MKKVRIAHLADFHLGGEVLDNNEISEQINKNLIKTLVEIFRMLNSAKVQIVLIAGDFYETSSVDNHLLNNIKEIFDDFQGKIVISPGNHDYVSLESVYNGKWPNNTHIFLKEEIEFIEFKEMGVRVYGFGFNSSHISQRLLTNVKGVDQQFINLGVFHGQIDNKINQYHPIFLEDIEMSKLDYIALGHVHKRSDIMKIGSTYYAYSGNPVGRGFDETGEKGIYLGDISKDRNGLNFYKVNNSEFHIVNIEIKSFISQIDIAEEIRNKLEENFGNNYKRNYYRIIIKGLIREDQNINFDIISAKLADIRYLEFEDSTSMYLDVENIINENSLKGKFANNVINLKNKDEKDILKILDFGIRAFEDLL